MPIIEKRLSKNNYFMQIFKKFAPNLKNFRRPSRGEAKDYLKKTILTFSKQKRLLKKD